MWLRGSPDRYFVPSETTRDRLERLRPGSAAITTVTGIPVDPACTDAVTRAEARVQLGRDGGAPSVVLMSGGIGGGPIARAMEVLLTAGSPGGAQVDLTVVCGRNERARKRCLASLNGKPAKGADAQVLGYVPHDEFLLRLRAADIIVGKPGGVTMAEALACGAPMIIYRPMLIPGQEEDNAAFLLDTGSAIKADGPDDLRQTVAGLLSTPERLARMQANALAASRPGAAFAIADALLAS
jgi:processive 1,2-diacylglycerol beta-glucosyltransferase